MILLDKPYVSDFLKRTIADTGCRSSALRRRRNSG
jgi:hypothetical protein